MITARRPTIFDHQESYENVEEADVVDDDGNIQQNPWSQIFGGGNFSGANTHRKRSHTPSLDKSNFKVLFEIAKRQIIILAVLFLLAVAATFFLKQYTLLYSNTGSVTGAGFTDIHICLLYTSYKEAEMKKYSDTYKANKLPEYRKDAASSDASTEGKTIPTLREGGFTYSTSKKMTDCSDTSKTSKSEQSSMNSATSKAQNSYASKMQNSSTSKAQSSTSVSYTHLVPV